MRNLKAVLIVLFTFGVALSGCAGKGGEDTADGDPSKYTDADKFDNAVGNEGFQVSGGLTGSGAAIDPASAFQLQIVDNVPSDSAGAQDKATLVLDAKTTGMTAQATMRSMVRGEDIGASYDFKGGAAQNVRTQATAGSDLAGLPDVKAFMIAFGLARLSLNGQLLSAPVPVVAATTLGMRGPGGEVLAAEDTHDLEMHVIFYRVPSVPGGIVYFYFENVVMSTLDAADRGKVGAGLVAFEPPNVAPTISARILVDDQQASSAMKEGNGTANVTFDATASTDPDGTIDAYSWEIFELTNTSVYQPADDRRANGAQVSYAFKDPGAKLVNLRIIDNDGAIATTNLSFYVDHHRISNYPGGTLQPGAVFVACQDAFNCNGHDVTIDAGIQQAVFKFVNKADTAPTGVHMDLYGPEVSSCPGAGSTEEPVASTTESTLTVKGDKLAETGKYKLCVWFQGGAQAEWDIDITLTYSPLTT